MEDLLASRRSCRKFLDKQVGDEAVRKLVWAACQAPAGGNSPRWEVIVVRRPELKRQIMEAALRQEFIEEAGVVFVFVGGREFNVACAVENMLLMAHALGLEGCVVGSFDREAVRKILGVPDEVKINMVVPVGFPKVEETNPGKKLPEEVAHYEVYGSTRISKSILKKVVDEAVEKVEEFERLLSSYIEKYGEESMEVYRLEEKYAAFVFKPLLTRISRLLRLLGYVEAAEEVEEVVKGYSNERWRRLSETGDINSASVVEHERKYSREVFPVAIRRVAARVAELLGD